MSAAMDEKAKPFAACWPWSHQWTQWQQQKADYIATPGPLFRDRTPTRITKEWQERRCTHCGKVQREELR